MRISIQLEDEDLKYFQDIIAQAQKAVKAVVESQLLQKAEELLNHAKKTRVPVFVEQRLRSLELLLLMLRDEDWNLTGDDRLNVLSVLTYFIEPADLIHDEVPVLGFLDDAIMIELIVRELKHELEAYQDFLTYKEAFAHEKSEGVPTSRRHKWLANKRNQLRRRMHRRSSRRYQRAQRKRFGRSTIRLF